MNEIYLVHWNCYYSKSTGDTFMQLGKIRTDEDSVLIGPTRYGGCVSAMNKAQLAEYIAVLTKILEKRVEI